MVGGRSRNDGISGARNACGLGGPLRGDSGLEDRSQIPVLGAACQIRTGDLLITNQLLYQLS
jgi:hypothetical protein